MFITHRDKTQQLLDFSDKASPYQNSRITWIRSRRGSDSETPKGISDMNKNTSKGEAPWPTHSQSVLTPANRTVLDRLRHLVCLSHEFPFSAAAAPAEFYLPARKHWPALPLPWSLHDTSELGNTTVFQGWLQHTSDSQTEALQTSPHIWWRVWQL